ALADHYRSADVFVFPSLTETFGIVLIEAMACGLPIAGFPATGPVDVVTRPLLGCVDENLHKAARTALAAPGTAAAPAAPAPAAPGAAPAPAAPGAAPAAAAPAGTGTGTLDPADISKGLGIKR
ncbi:MAG: glycosyltransferase, partial [Burkholderiales bacterium]|nr:glycosyltransferase [Burkholderiales bacterium]